MARRNRREGYIPADLTAPPRPPGTPFSEWRSGSQRQAAARNQGGIDWSACVIPGCHMQPLSELTVGVTPSQARDTDKTLPMCAHHTAIAWKQFQRLNGNPEALGISAEIHAAAEVDREHDAEVAAQEAHARRHEGHIYFVRLNGLIKAGWSADLVKRFKQYGASVEVLCHYPATRQDETTLHQQLRPALAKGREWYHDTDVVRLFVDRALETYGPPSVEAFWSQPKRPAQRVKNYRG